MEFYRCQILVIIFCVYGAAGESTTLFLDDLTTDLINMTMDEITVTSFSDYHTTDNPSERTDKMTTSTEADDELPLMVIIPVVVSVVVLVAVTVGITLLCVKCCCAKHTSIRSSSCCTCCHADDSPPPPPPPKDIVDRRSSPKDSPETSNKDESEDKDIPRSPFYENQVMAATNGRAKANTYTGDGPSEGYRNTNGDEPIPEGIILCDVTIDVEQDLYVNDNDEEGESLIAIARAPTVVYKDPLNKTQPVANISHVSETTFTTPQAENEQEMYVNYSTLPQQTVDVETALQNTDNTSETNNDVSNANVQQEDYMNIGDVSQHSAVEAANSEGILRPHNAHDTTHTDGILRTSQLSTGSTGSTHAKRTGVALSGNYANQPAVDQHYGIWPILDESQQKATKPPTKPPKPTTAKPNVSKHRPTQKPKHAQTLPVTSPEPEDDVYLTPENEDRYLGPETDDVYTAPDPQTSNTLAEQETYMHMQGVNNRTQHSPPQRARTDLRGHKNRRFQTADDPVYTNSVEVLSTFNKGQKYS